MTKQLKPEPEQITVAQHQRCSLPLHLSATDSSLHCCYFCKKKKSNFFCNEKNKICKKTNAKCYVRQSRCKTRAIRLKIRPSLNSYRTHFWSTLHNQQKTEIYTQKLWFFFAWNCKRFSVVFEKWKPKNKHDALKNKNHFSNLLHPFKMHNKGNPVLRVVEKSVGQTWPSPFK